jgi:hypothetical protein
MSQRIRQQPRHREIQILFIRFPNEITSHFDDILHIKKLSENQLYLTYIERTEDGEHKEKFVMTYTQTISYLYRVFWLLGIDEDPFKSVQFLIPGYPSVLIPVTVLQQNINIFMELLSTTCTAWPRISN